MEEILEIHENNPTNSEKNHDDKFSEVEPGVYRVSGALTADDIERINTIKENSVFILDNTAGLSSDLISKIESVPVFFSIKGGLDYENIQKFNTDEYKERTKMSPKGLETVIRYFERIEGEIEPEWTDLQKCMYVYNALATDIMYCYDELDVDKKYDRLVPGDTIVRSLNGIMYGELVCAGFALTFKEMMDRVGIECSYQNVPKTHDFNIVSINGKNYGVDLTWDNCKAHKEKGSDCGFANFGQDGDFYSRHAHSVAMKDRLKLSIFSPKEIDYNRSVIATRIAVRERGPEKSFSDLSSKERGEYLPIKKEELQADTECGDFVKLLSVLTTTGVLSDRNSEFSLILQQRVGFVRDLVGGYFYNAKTETGKEDLERLRILSNAKKFNDEYSKSELDSCITSINSQLEFVMANYVRALYESANDIIKDFDKNDTDDIRRTNEYTKLVTIRNAKQYLIENGHDSQEVEDICKKIDGVLNVSIDDFEEIEGKKSYLEVLGEILENELVEALQKDDISEEYFAKNFVDSSVWTRRFMENNPGGYNLSETEIKSLIDDILKKYSQQ
ncbi:MAG TPA: hypothetical protein PLX95_02410 [bacterium]|nr:hypothetical protein [bacterium]